LLYNQADWSNDLSAFFINLPARHNLWLRGRSRGRKEGFTTN
jgi:hypothetical protein